MIQGIAGRCNISCGSLLVVRTYSSRPKSELKRSADLPRLRAVRPLKATQYIQNTFPSLEAIAADDLVLKKTEPLKASWYHITRTRSGMLPVYTEVKKRWRCQDYC